MSRHSSRKIDFSSNLYESEWADTPATNPYVLLGFVSGEECLHQGLCLLNPCVVRDGVAYICLGPGPFTDEHVVSAGIGGDDQDWLLGGCVCGECNRVFSKLETKVLRSSPIAIARLFLQPQTRHRGSKTGAPSLQPAVSYFEDEASRVLLEQELEAGGRPAILPQLSLYPAQCPFPRRRKSGCCESLYGEADVGAL